MHTSSQGNLKSIPHDEDTTVRRWCSLVIRFILFALKDLTKKWLYSLAENSITLWDDFVKAFLKKFYSIHKTTFMRKNIMQCKQESNEPFWKHFECFNNLLAQRPHHGVEKWRQYQILYDGLDYQNKTPRNHVWGRFLKKDEIWVGNLWRFSRKNFTIGTFQRRVQESQLYLFQKRSPLDRGLHSNWG